MDNLVKRWQSEIIGILKQPEFSEPLKKAALETRMRDWTQALTGVVVEAFNRTGFRAAAKGHLLDCLPVSRNEYLSLDVVAFPQGQSTWHFPIGAVELENSQDDKIIAYSLWKVLCVRADLRIVFCYRKTEDGISKLIRLLRDEVVEGMQIQSRVNLAGDTLVVVGTHGEINAFPYGFFKWWRLEKNTGRFELI
jgi:hypothetical protein